MTTRTYTHLSCPCGHRGTIVESENDQPYSKQWTSTNYRDDDLRRYAGEESGFAAFGMACPKCGAPGRPS